MKKLKPEQFEDGQTKAYVVPWEFGFKVWRPDRVPHLSSIVFKNESDALKVAIKINKRLEKSNV